MSAIRIGIDIGGTKIEAAAVRGERDVLWRERVPTPQGDYDASVRAVVEIIARVATDMRSFGRRINTRPGKLLVHFLLSCMAHFAGCADTC